MQRHAAPDDSLEVVGFDDFAGAGGDDNLPLVQVCDNKSQPRQRLQQRDFLFHDEVGALAREFFVFGFLHHKHNVAGDGAWCFVSLAAERNLLTVLHALFNRHLQHLLFLCNLFASASRALVVVRDGLALAVARTARRLHLLDHGAHAPDDDLVKKRVRKEKSETQA